MFKFIFQRTLQSIPVLFIIVTVTFLMVRSVPGGPFTQERQVSPQIIERMNEYYGLNDPLPVQYATYLKNVILRGDLGPSFRNEGRTVNEMIGEAFPVSLQLGGLALLIAIGLGVPAGLISAIKRNTFLDYGPMSLAMIGICLPTFVVGPLLALVFGLQLGWFNVSGWFSWQDRILPASTLGLYYAAYFARLTRGGMLEVLGQDFIRTARAKGVSETTVIFKHALKGGLLPVITFLGPAIAGLLSGSFVVELVFQIPGLGRHFVNSALNRDYSLVLGTVLFYAVLIIVMNLLADIVQVLLNPKLRFE